MKELWDRAIKMDFYGETVYVPSPEDMFVHQLDTRARAIFRSEALSRRMRWLYDCRHIIQKAEPDWSFIIRRIKEYHVENSEYLMLQAFADCFPSLLSRELLENWLTPDAEYEKWLETAMDSMRIWHAYEAAERFGDFWYSVRLWPRLLCTDYRFQYYDRKSWEGNDLTFLQYLKWRYQTDQEKLARIMKTAKKIKRE